MVNVDVLNLVDVIIILRKSNQLVFDVVVQNHVGAIITVGLTRNLTKTNACQFHVML